MLGLLNDPGCEIAPLMTRFAENTTVGAAFSGGRCRGFGYDALPIHFCNSASGTLRPCSGRI